jgi:uncharacterized protein (UPF0147 family)
MEDELIEIIDILEFLIVDLPVKVRSEIEEVIENLNKSTDPEMLLKIRDDLESISNMSNVDSYSRNELMNAIASLESIVNK